MRPFDGGVLIAAVDGLGHGAPAAEAAALAIGELARAPSRDVKGHLLACHQTLRATRGAVASVARCDAARGELTWAGVGNIEGVLMRYDARTSPRQQSLLVFGGVLGGHLAGVRESSLSLQRGDLLVFATDGIRPDFCREIDRCATARQIADDVLVRCGRGDDDALVLVARWSGERA